MLQILDLAKAEALAWVRQGFSQSHFPFIQHSSDHPSALFLFQALSGPHYYTWGDHGGILVAIAQGTETDQLK